VGFIITLAQRDVRAWLLVAIITLAITAYEVGALETYRYHTISYFAYRYPLVRFGVAGLFAALLVWWLYHSAHDHIV
jgi:hypothetical protein